jgi:hypothetical protein
VDILGGQDKSEDLFFSFVFFDFLHLKGGVTLSWLDWLPWRRKSARGQTHSSVQTRSGGAHPFDALRSYVPNQVQVKVYRQMRDDIPIIGVSTGCCFVYVPESFRQGVMATVVIGLIASGTYNYVKSDKGKPPS